MSDQATTRLAEIRATLDAYLTGPSGIEAWSELKRNAIPDLEFLLSLAEQLQGQLDRARALHRVDEVPSCGNPQHTNRDPGVICPECVDVCEHDCEPWPCPTAEVIGLGEGVSGDR